MVLNIPYFAHEHWWSCGPATLRMVLSFLGVDVAEDHLAKLAGAEWDGTTCDRLACAAERLGFDAELFENLPFWCLQEILSSGTPFIALLDAGVLYYDVAGFGHLVVVLGFDQQEVVYHDPEHGAFQRAGYQRFWQAWGELDYLGVRIWKPAGR